MDETAYPRKWLSIRLDGVTLKWVPPNTGTGGMVLPL